MSFAHLYTSVQCQRPAWLASDQITKNQHSGNKSSGARGWKKKKSPLVVSRGRTGLSQTKSPLRLVVKRWPFFGADAQGDPLRIFTPASHNEPLLAWQEPQGWDGALPVAVAVVGSRYPPWPQYLLRLGHNMIHAKGRPEYSATHIRICRACASTHVIMHKITPLATHPETSRGLKGNKAG